jgi:hypothetical protein
VTDLLDEIDRLGDEDSPDEEEVDPEEVSRLLGPPLSEDQCQFYDEHGQRCTLLLPLGHHKTRKFCDGHIKGGYLIKEAKRRKSDRPPVNVKVNLGAAKGAKLQGDQQRVLEAATAWLGLVSGVLEASGDKVCAEATTQAAPQIAMQLALLAKYHPLIVKVLAPVEASGEALVWVSLLVAVSPLIITVLSHHNLISEEVAGRIGIVTAMGAVVGKAAPEEEAA